MISRSRFYLYLLFRELGGELNFLNLGSLIRELGGKVIQLRVDERVRSANTKNLGTNFTYIISSKNSNRRTVSS